MKAFKLFSRARDGKKWKKRSLFAPNISMIALSLIITIISIAVVIIIIIIIEWNPLHRYGIDSLDNIRIRLPVMSIKSVYFPNEKSKGQKNILNWNEEQIDNHIEMNETDFGFNKTFMSSVHIFFSYSRNDSPLVLWNHPESALWIYHIDELYDHTMNFLRVVVSINVLRYFYWYWCKTAMKSFEEKHIYLWIWGIKPFFIDIRIRSLIWQKGLVVRKSFTVNVSI